MTEAQIDAPAQAVKKPARDWVRQLAAYRQPNHARSVTEILLTTAAFAALWALCYWAMSVSYLLTLAIALPASAFLVRLFLIQHDCGHGAFFKSPRVNNWVGRIAGIFTLTPYEVWRRDHAVHHATSGNLDERGTGDIDTMTVREYTALSPLRRLQYRLYRNPIVLFVIGPAYQFILRNRLPCGFSKANISFWLSFMGTNAAIALAVGVMVWLVGWKAFLMIQLPVTLIASSIGVWLFYVQHQFEDVYWERAKNWQVHDAALYGSTHYDLPKVLAWLTANIGIHHVHHMYSRIPYYRLPQVLRDFPELANVHRVTLWQSFSFARLRLWDETRRRLVPLSAIAT